MVHAVPRGVQLPARHLYLLERLEDKVAAVNSRIGAWQQWLAAALASAAGAGGAGGGGDAENGGGSRSSGVEWAPVGAPVQVGVWLGLAQKRVRRCQLSCFSVAQRLHSTESLVQSSGWVVTCHESDWPSLLCDTTYPVCPAVLPLLSCALCCHNTPPPQLPPQQPQHTRRTATLLAASCVRLRAVS